MSKLYGEQHRGFQDEFETRKLADTIEDVIGVTAEFLAQEKTRGTGDELSILVKKG